MPEKIQEVPATLLDVLGIKSLGRNPDQLLDSVSGTVDLTEFYLTRRLEVLNAITTNVIVAGQFARIQIPDGEVWLVKDVVGILRDPLIGGEIMNGVILWERDALGTPPRMILAQAPSHVATTTSIDEMTTATIHFRQRFFQTGTSFRVVSTEAPGVGNYDLELGVSFYRLTF